MPAKRKKAKKIVQAELPPTVEPPVPDPTELPGMVGEGVERLVILPLEAAADEADRLKGKMNDAKEAMDKAVAEVRKIMKDYDITSYSYRGKLIEREAKEDAVKIKHKAEYASMSALTDALRFGNVSVKVVN